MFVKKKKIEFKVRINGIERRLIVECVQELNRKSVLVEEAVEEVLNLVQKANNSVAVPKLEHEPSFKGTIRALINYVQFTAF